VGIQQATVRELMTHKAHEVSYLFCSIYTLKSAVSDFLQKVSY